jgi:hypothetical protein
MANLQKEIWIRQIQEKFYPETSFLQFVTDFSAYVENDKIHMAEAGLDPEILVNNTTYPIAVAKREDKPLEFTLDLFETKNTLVRTPDAIELAYDKLDSVIYGHRNALRVKTHEKAAHAFAPNEDTENTPVIPTTGEADDDRKRLRVEDILKLKRRFDLLDVPTDKRYLVLDPRHTEDLILHDLKTFKDITDFKNGMPKRFAGFNILEFTRNPKYSETLEKVPFGDETTTDLFSSFAFYADEVMKADGKVDMYRTDKDPKERATIIGFDKRFIALPIREKAIAAIVSAKS